MVRKQLTRIAGGGLARACRAGRLIALIISDVPGDPLDVIASGPTVENQSTPEQALVVLRTFDAGRSEIPAAVYEYLTAAIPTPHPRPLSHRFDRPTAGKGRGEEDDAFGVEPSSKSDEKAAANPTCRVTNVIIGNNATAVDGAGVEAERLGYSHAMVSATRPEGPVEGIGRHLAEMAIAMRDGAGPDCLISGGEGTVRLAPAGERGLGGRNQQLTLAVLIRLAEHDLHDIAVVSAGTDGEDGPDRRRRRDCR